MKLGQWMLSVAMLSAMLLSMTACNTVEGAGKDTQRAGEKIEGAADRNK